MDTNQNKTKKQDETYAKFWKERCPRLPLLGVTPPLLDIVKGELFAKKLSDQTVLHYLKFLRHVLNLAVRDGRLNRNPFIQVRLPKMTKGRLRFLSIEEETKLLEKIGATFAPWVRFAILTGVR